MLDRDAQMDKPNQWLDDTAWDNITELDKYDTIPTHTFSLLFYLFISFLLFHLKFNCMYVYNFSFPCIPCTLVFFFICLFFVISSPPSTLISFLFLQAGQLYGHCQLIWSVPQGLASMVHFRWTWEHPTARCCVQSLCLLRLSFPRYLYRVYAKD